MTVGSVDEVLEALDRVIDRSIREGDRCGYFAALYRKVTAKVKQGIEQGFFDDAGRMGRLDAAFAERYLEALAAHREGSALTASWRHAFDAGPRWRPIVLQHLLVGVNAHINLDLGIAAARTAPRDAFPLMRRDFDRINEILAQVMGQVQRNLGTVSPWIGLLDRIGGRHDDEVVRFSIVVARAQAWRFGAELAPVPPDQWAAPIAVRDAGVARLARTVLNPGMLSTGLLMIRLRETRDVAATIEALLRAPEPSLAEVEAQVRKG